MGSTPTSLEHSRNWITKSFLLSISVLFLTVNSPFDCIQGSILRPLFLTFYINEVGNQLGTDLFYWWLKNLKSYKQSDCMGLQKALHGIQNLCIVNRLFLNVSSAVVQRYHVQLCSEILMTFSTVHSLIIDVTLTIYLFTRLNIISICRVKFRTVRRNRVLVILELLQLATKIQPIILIGKAFCLLLCVCIHSLVFPPCKWT